MFTDPNIKLKNLGHPMRVVESLESYAQISNASLHR
jgi:hypothetical protein